MSVITITNDNKGSSTGDTFDSDPPRTFADDGTFDVPGIAVYNEAKNNITITNEAKGPVRKWENALYEWGVTTARWQDPDFFVIKNEAK